MVYSLENEEEARYIQEALGKNGVLSLKLVDLLYYYFDCDEGSSKQRMIHDILKEAKDDFPKFGDLDFSRADDCRQFIYRIIGWERTWFGE